MKRIILLILIIFCYRSVSAQTNSSKKVFVLKSNAAKSVKTIPPTKAVTIRKDDLDSMNEIGETESLGLQIATDRLSKMMNALTNMLKKSAIYHNQLLRI